MVVPGLLVVDKPAGVSSHDVVARCRRLLDTRRVGHGGTLDPMATGVLVLGVGWATRLLTYVIGHDKTYTATVRLGQRTVTDDAEGDTMSTAPAGHLEPAAVDAAVATLTGAIAQVPSAVSAIKVDGRRSYARVRAGEEVELAARPVTVHSFDVLARRVVGDLLDLDVVVRVSSGTYVRALARDLGDALGVGGHLTALRRTSSGPFTEDDAVHLPGRADGEAETEAARLRALEALVPLPEAAARCFDTRTVDATTAQRLRNGQRLEPWGTGERPVAALAPDGALVALVLDRGGAARPVLGVPTGTG